MHYGEFALMDYSESIASFRVYFGAITAVSLPGFLTNFGALRTALDNITLGTLHKERWVGDETVLDSVPPNDPMAQRELKWMCHFENMTQGNYFRLTIACPDLSLATVTKYGEQYANLSDPKIQAFITAIEEIIADPVYGTVDCRMYEMEIVGRNQ